MKRRIWIPGLILLLGGSAVVWAVTHKGEPPLTWRTEPLQRGAVRVQVSATGTLRAVTTVQVGSQVTGTISALNVDFNDQVHRGQVLAQLDPTFLKAQVAQSRAELERAVVQLRQAERDSSRAFALGKQGLASQADLDQSQTAIDAARASVSSAQAALERAQTNLRYATISSPIDGVVISRDVDVGQTVAASLSAPTLFTIANDLTQMQLEAAVDEADIGSVRAGQAATFTVDSYPDLSFRGEVHQVRLQPETVQNVVTYTVVIYVQNPDLKLLPGMTANVSILIDQAEDVLKVPAAALKLQLGGRGDGNGRPGGFARNGGNGGGGNGERAGGARMGSGGPPMMGGRRPEGGGGMPGGPGGMGSPGGLAGGPAGEHGRGGPGDGGSFGPRNSIYLLGPGNKPHRVHVRTGLSDGSFTAVYSDSLKEGDAVIIGSDRPGGTSAAPQGAVNPFGPRFPGGQGGRR